MVQNWFTLKKMSDEWSIMRDYAESGSFQSLTLQAILSLGEKRSDVRDL